MTLPCVTYLASNLPSSHVFFFFPSLPWLHLPKQTLRNVGQLQRTQHTAARCCMDTYHMYIHPCHLRADGRRRLDWQVAHVMLRFMSCQVFCHTLNTNPMSVVPVCWLRPPACAACETPETSASLHCTSLECLTCLLALWLHCKSEYLHYLAVSFFSRSLSLSWLTYTYHTVIVPPRKLSSIKSESLMKSIWNKPIFK